MKIHRSMIVAIVFTIVLSIAGCSDRGSRSPEPSPAAQSEAASPTPAAEPEAAPATTTASPEAEVAAAAEKTPAPAATEAASAPATATSEPAPSSSPAPSPSSAPAPSPAPDAAPARIEVSATKPGLTRVGADKCKICHKVQHESWVASKHAAQSPVLDCESCHGPGSEYKTMAIMKDPAQAKAAGLVMPGKEFCMKCHQADWSDDKIVKVHAHKPK